MATCPLCQTESTPAFSAGEHRMFRCRSCALVFVDPCPTADYLSRFYSQFHRSSQEGGTYDEVEGRARADFPAKLQLVRSTLRQPGAKLLDVGCGKGYFVQCCNEAGFVTEGIDLSDTAVAWARDRLGVTARCGSVEDITEGNAPYDAATFWATVEHVRKPVEMLCAIRRVLKPQGHLFLDTGVAGDLLDRLLPGVVQWYDPPQHLFVFSKRAIALLLDKAGFDVLSVDMCFDRSTARRVTRTMRGVACACVLRAVAELARINPAGPFPFTRFPLGNLMSVVARAR